MNAKNEGLHYLPDFHWEEAVAAGDRRVIDRLLADCKADLDAEYRDTYGEPFGRDSLCMSLGNLLEAAAVAGTPLPRSHVALQGGY